jgi:diadenosine tetraphosphatase ApaH/serine/threonine PP2A family protein phosphatase
MELVSYGIELFRTPKHVKHEHWTVTTNPDALLEPKFRVIAIGDVHGCLEELKELWDNLQVTPYDLVVFLGDLVDRGPDSEGVVQFAIERKAGMVIGNHDEKCLRYHWHVLNKQADPAYKIPMKEPPSYSGLSESSLLFMASANYAITISVPGQKDTIFVHAGVTPALFKQDPKAFIRNRYLTKNQEGRLVPTKSVNVSGTWYVPEGAVPWHYCWDGSRRIVYGHIVNRKPEVLNNTIGIDGGCCFGGRLRAWVETRDESFFVEVPAKKVYCTESDKDA